MKHHHRIQNPALFFVTGTLLLIAAASAAAEERSKELDAIVVQAPISIETQVLQNPGDPTMKTEVVELKREVFIGDLDLARHADVVELESRIAQMAKDSCDALSEMFPLSKFSSKELKRCVDEAIKSARKEKDAAIEAAQ